MIAISSVLGCASSATGDADLVFCLDPANRPRLVTAAEHLGLATPAAEGQVHVGESDLTLEQWHDDARRSGDFKRACTALRGADSDGAAGSGGGWSATVTSLLSVLLTALLSVLGTALMNRRGRRRQAAERLRGGAERLREAGQAYLAGRAGQDRLREDTAMLSARDEMRATLRAVELEYPTWPEAGRLRERLGRPPLSDADDPGDPDHDRLVEQGRAWLDEQVRGALDLARALERPIRYRWGRWSGRWPGRRAGGRGPAARASAGGCGGAGRSR